MVFEWPFTVKHFHRAFHRLQRQAGIEKANHFGLHTLRRTLATRLAETSLDSARFVLGHADSAVTQQFYVDAGRAAAAALDSLEQPAAFMPRAIAGPAISPEIPDRRVELANVLAVAGLTPDQALTILKTGDPIGKDNSDGAAQSKTHYPVARPVGPMPSRPSFPHPGQQGTVT